MADWHMRRLLWPAWKYSSAMYFRAGQRSLRMRQSAILKSPSWLSCSSDDLYQQEKKIFFSRLGRSIKEIGEYKVDIISWEHLYWVLWPYANKKGLFKGHFLAWFDVTGFDVTGKRVRTGTLTQYVVHISYGPHTPLSVYWGCYFLAPHTRVLCMVSGSACAPNCFMWDSNSLLKYFINF